MNATSIRDLIYQLLPQCVCLYYVADKLCDGKLIFYATQSCDARGQSLDIRYYTLGEKLSFFFIVCFNGLITLEKIIKNIREKLLLIRKGFT